MCVHRNCSPGTGVASIREGLCECDPHVHGDRGGGMAEGRLGQRGKSIAKSGYAVHTLSDPGGGSVDLLPHLPTSFTFSASRYSLLNAFSVPGVVSYSLHS